MDFRPDSKALLVSSNGSDDKTPFVMTLDVRDGETRRYELPKNLVPVDAVFGNDNATIHLLAGDLDGNKVALVSMEMAGGELLRRTDIDQNDTRLDDLIGEGIHAEVVAATGTGGNRHQQ